MNTVLFQIAAGDMQLPFWAWVVGMLAAGLLGRASTAELVQPASRVRDTAAATEATTTLNRQLYRELGRRPPGHIRAVPAVRTTRMRLASPARPVARPDRPTPRLNAARTWVVPIPPPPATDNDRCLRPLPADQQWALRGFDDPEVDGERVEWAAGLNLAAEAVHNPAGHMHTIEMEAVSA